MMYRLLQLNIQKASHLDPVIDYISKHKFDIVCLQEVARNFLSKSTSSRLEGGIARHPGILSLICISCD